MVLVFIIQFVQIVIFHFLQYFPKILWCHIVFLFFPVAIGI